MKAAAAAGPVASSNKKGFELLASLNRASSIHFHRSSAACVCSRDKIEHVQQLQQCSIILRPRGKEWALCSGWGRHDGASLFIDRHLLRAANTARHLTIHFDDDDDDQPFSGQYATLHPGKPQGGLSAFVSISLSSFSLLTMSFASSAL